MEERMTFEITDENGVNKQVEILFTFTSEETKKNYMVYTDNAQDEEGNIKTYVATYEEISENTKLSPVTSDEEFRMVEDILNEYQESLEE